MIKFCQFIGNVPPSPFGEGMPAPARIAGGRTACPNWDRRAKQAVGEVKKLLLFFFTFSFSLFTYLQVQAQGLWTQKASLPAPGRGYSIGFSIGSYGYVGLGYGVPLDSVKGINYHDFWQYNPSTNTWIQKADFPGKARILPETFVIGNYAYIVCGVDSTDDESVNECWQYNAITNKWTQKANFPGGSRCAGIGFAIGNKGYIGSGAYWYGPYYHDIWQYDTGTDTWKQKANLAGNSVYTTGGGFSVGDKGYVCFGGDSNLYFTNQMWEYDTQANLWTQKNACPCAPRYCENGFVINNNIYVGSGFDSSLNDSRQFWKYNPALNSWTQQANIPGMRKCVCSAFSIGDTGYLGLGIDSVGNGYNTLYAFYPDTLTKVKEIYNYKNSISIYPNPVKQILYMTLNRQINEPTVLSISDNSGRNILSIDEKNLGIVTQIDVSSLTNGYYFLNIKNNNFYFAEKFIKQ